MIRCFETSQLSQKFQRNVDAEIVQVQVRFGMRSERVDFD